MAIGAVGGFDYEMYKQPINYTSAVNPFSTGVTGTTGGAKHAQPVGMQERELDPQMIAAKREGFEWDIGGTNNADDHKIFFAA